MAKVTEVRGSVTLESTFQITEGQRDVIKNEKEKVESLLKDFHASHTLAATEDGTAISKLSKKLFGTIDLEEKLKALEEDHKEFLHQVDMLAEESKKSDDDTDDDTIMTGIFIPVILFQA